MLKSPFWPTKSPATAVEDSAPILQEATVSQWQRLSVDLKKKLSERCMRS